MPDTDRSTGLSTRAFWFLWGFDALVAAIVLFFFFWGLADGTVSSFNGLLWFGTLSAVIAVGGGGLALRHAGHTAAAIILLLVLALPGLAATLFMVAIIVLQPRWN